MPNNGEVLSRLFCSDCRHCNLFTDQAIYSCASCHAPFVFFRAVHTFNPLVSQRITQDGSDCSIDFNYRCCVCNSCICWRRFFGWSVILYGGYFELYCIGTLWNVVSQNSDVPTVDWWIVALAPLLLCVANCFQYRRVMILVLWRFSSYVFHLLLPAFKNRKSANRAGEY